MRLLFCKSFRIRTLFVLVCVLSALFSYVIFSNRKSVAKTVRPSSHRVPKNTNRELEIRNISKFQDENVLDVITRYWELVRAKPQSKTSSTEFGNNATTVMNISEYALTTRNLWSTIDYSNPTAEHDDRILAQLVWIMEAAKNPSINQLKVQVGFETKKILLENPGEWDFNGDMQNCPGFGDKCEFRDEPFCRSKRLSRAEVDAVVTLKAIPDPGRLNMDKDVLQFFVLYESSVNGGAVFQRQDDILSSYWRASHLVTPYGKWVYYNPSTRRQSQELNYAAGKTKLAAIVISNCYFANNRLVYVKQLQNHIKVDVYGKCGPFLCPKETCFQQLKKQYKFYLAFENSNCRDYITEKFFLNALSNDMVPVVMGSHPSDYRAGAPENSYIHVEDFQSPQALAEYLQYLDENDTEYNKYFEWKGLGELIDSKFLCRACAMTHYADFVPPPKVDTVFIWEDIPKHKLCLKKDEVFWKLRTL